VIAQSEEVAKGVKCGIERDAAFCQVFARRSQYDVLRVRGDGHRTLVERHLQRAGFVIIRSHNGGLLRDVARAV
jgi:hypothetical protein